MSCWPVIFLISISVCCSNTLAFAKAIADAQEQEQLNSDKSLNTNHDVLVASFVNPGKSTSLNQNDPVGNSQHFVNLSPDQMGKFVPKSREQPKVIEQKFIKNETGEYKFDIKFSDGTRRAESADFEERDGELTLIVRGLYAHVGKGGEYKVNLYVIDHNGYHQIPLSTSVSQGATIDFRPDIEGLECSMNIGYSCIDVKLLQILVG